MLLTTLIIIPLIGIITILLLNSYDKSDNKILLKIVALTTSLLNLMVSLIVWILFNCSSKYFQFIQEHHNIGYYDFYLGVDGLSIYFVLLTTIIMPVSLISNWKSVTEKIIYFLSIILLLETLLLLIYMVLDLLMFYIFFESILAPLFILIGIFGSIEKQRASFYFFLYTFLGSLFMLLSIITVSYLSGCTDINIISRNGFIYITQILIFMGIFIAFAVKTPVIYLNGWLLKAHVESPLSGSIILAAIVLKLSLYGIFRLILILLPKAFIVFTYIIFTIGVITIIYASLSTLRTVDIKELIAYSSVSHAAVYFIAVFSNVIQGIVGSICLGLAHGFVSSGLFAIVGGVLYDRSGTRLISFYRGLVQAMPILSILFFILCLGNCGAPLTFNFIGEFMSLYGVFERLPLAGVFASSSIVFSAAFTIFMYNRIMFGGSLFKYNWIEYIIDLNLREYSLLLVLVIFTVSLGIYPSIVTDGLNYVSQGLLFTFNALSYENNIVHNDTSPYTMLFVCEELDLFSKYVVTPFAFFCVCCILPHTSIYLFRLLINQIINYLNISPYTPNTNSKGIKEEANNKYIITSPYRLSDIFEVWKNKFIKIFSLVLTHIRDIRKEINSIFKPEEESKNWWGVLYFDPGLIINMLCIVVLPLIFSLYMVHNYMTNLVVDRQLIVICIMCLSTIVFLILSLIYNMEKKSIIERIKLKGYNDYIIRNLVDFFFLQLSIVGLISFCLFYSNISYLNLCYIKIWVIFSISFLVFNFYFSEEKKISITKYIYEIYKKGEIFKTIIKNVKNNWLNVICFVLCIYTIRFFFFTASNDIIQGYLTIIYIAKSVGFTFSYVSCKVNKQTWKNAFFNSLTLTIKTCTHKYLIIGLILYTIILLLKLFIVSQIAYLYSTGICLCISFIKINLNFGSFLKFYLENKNNLFRLNFTKIKFGSLFNCILGVTKATLNLQLQFNKGFSESLRLKIIPGGEASGAESEYDNFDGESSTDKIHDCPGGDSHDYALLIARTNWDHDNMTKVHFRLEVVAEESRQAQDQRIWWLEHIVRHHQLRDTPLGFKSYGSLFFFAAHYYGVYDYLGYRSRMILCQDANLAMNIEKLKFANPGMDPNITEMARKQGSRVIDDVRAMRKYGPNPCANNHWTYKIPYTNSEPTYNYDAWSVGTLGLNNRNQIIESIGQNRQGITFAIETKAIQYPTNGPEKVGNLIKVAPHFRKYAYDNVHSRRYSSSCASDCFYIISDPYNVATNDFTMENMHTPEIAYSLSFVLEDRLQNGKDSFYNVLDRRVANWCAAALNHQKAESRKITLGSIRALRNMDRVYY